MDKEQAPQGNTQQENDDLQYYDWYYGSMYDWYYGSMNEVENK